MGKIALCPGTYDPITEGHVDVIKRCIKVFDKVIIAVSKNPRKKPLYPILKRTEFIKKVFKKYDNIRVISFDGLLINLAEKENINVIVKGLRAISDFEYEFQMAQINKKLNPDIETMFLVTNPKYAYLSSSAVKEVAGLVAVSQGLVPKEIENDIIQTFYKKK